MILELHVYSLHMEKKIVKNIKTRIYSIVVVKRRHRGKHKDTVAIFPVNALCKSSKGSYITDFYCIRQQQYC